MIRTNNLASNVEIKQIWTPRNQKRPILKEYELWKSILKIVQLNLEGIMFYLTTFLLWIQNKKCSFHIIFCNEKFYYTLNKF